MSKPFKAPEYIPGEFNHHWLERVVQAFEQWANQPVQPAKGDEGDEQMKDRAWEVAGFVAAEIGHAFPELVLSSREGEDVFGYLRRLFLAVTITPNRYAKGDAPAAEADARELLIRAFYAAETGAGVGSARALEKRNNPGLERVLAYLTEALRRPARVVEDGEVAKVLWHKQEFTPENTIRALRILRAHGMAIVRIEDQPHV